VTSNSFSNQLIPVPPTAAVAQRNCVLEKQNIITAKLSIIIDQLLVAKKILTVHIAYAGTISFCIMMLFYCQGIQL